MEKSADRLPPSKHRLYSRPPASRGADGISFPPHTMTEIDEAKQQLKQAEDQRKQAEQLIAQQKEALKKQVQEYDKQIVQAGNQLNEFKKLRDKTAAELAKHR